MYTLLVSTISVLIINHNCYFFIDFVRNSTVFFIPELLPKSAYKNYTVLTAQYLSLAVCVAFVLPMSLLLYIQLVNLCKSKTTQERFSRQAAKQSKISF